MNIAVIILIVEALVVVPLSLFIMRTTPTLDDAFWERKLERDMARIKTMFPYASHLWRKLVQAIQDKESEEEINKIRDEIVEYIKLMANM
jgi:hypothetical protein